MKWLLNSHYSMNSIHRMNFKRNSNTFPTNPPHDETLWEPPSESRFLRVEWKRLSSNKPTKRALRLLCKVCISQNRYGLGLKEPPDEMTHFKWDYSLETMRRVFGLETVSSQNLALSPIIACSACKCSFNFILLPSIDLIDQERNNRSVCLLHFNRSTLCFMSLGERGWSDLEPRKIILHWNCISKILDSI